MSLLPDRLRRCAATFVLCAALPAQATPPATPVEPVTETFHGVAVTDPYRWMEDMKTPRWQDWLRAQSDYSAAVLSRIPGRDKLRARLLQLADAGEFVGDLQQAGGRVFYLKSEPGLSVRRLFMRPAAGGRERLLIDPEVLPRERGASHHAIDFFTPSPDGKRVAVGISQGGSEDSVLRVYDLETRQFLHGAIDRTGLNEGGVAWLPDGKGFFYNRLPAPAADGSAERYNKSALYLHRLGTMADKDVAVFGWGVDPRRSFAVPDLPFMLTAADSKWALAVVLHGDAPEISVYAAPLAAVKGAATPWRRLIGPQDTVTTVALAGDAVYALSQKEASFRKLLRYDLARPEAAPTLALPEGRIVLQRLAVARDAVYVKALDGGVGRLLRLPRVGGAVQPVALPFDGTIDELVTTVEQPGALVALESWTRAPAVYRVGADGTVTATDLQKPVKLDLSGIEASRVLVKSHDGVEVPLSILAPKGAARDGSHPTVVRGYGAYGIALEPRFSTAPLAWIERGGVLATCHVRGGGEFGADWHNAGRIITGTKQNTVSDFIACAEYLVAQGYTTRAKLAGSGGSAGGITIGGAIAQRPELFAAAHSAVGVSDLLRMEFTPNGAPNVAEFGSISDPMQFKQLLAISPYHGIKDGVAYPAVIVTTGANDPRVDAWLPGKFAARLQAATSSGKPVLLRVDYDAGHGMGSTRAQRAAETADVWSFFLWQMGEAGFQPAK
jgi:prolyl oligopeptidase